ncbi:phage tail tube protein [Paenibacillus sp. FSL H3-0333]|uniref:phage tail tube protein n=1 Tax=Paenibacillus sp. FSL H3-0333 TaxID=2921373 RepID=UPI0030F6CAEE
MSEGILSKDTKLSYLTTGTSYVDLLDLQEVPEVGGDPEQVEVTTLADATKRYIPGIRDLGSLAFTFLYDNSTNGSYRILSGLQADGDVQKFKITYPDGTSHGFAAFPSVKMGAASVNAPLTFTLTLTLNSEITVTNPA